MGEELKRGGWKKFHYSPIFILFSFSLVHKESLTLILGHNCKCEVDLQVVNSFEFLIER